MAVPKRISAASKSPKGPGVLAPLRQTKMLTTLKPTLPAEILALILDILPVADLLSFARTSRRVREMVYDDTRWVQRLRSMRCWNEAEARQQFEDAMRRKLEAQRARNGDVGSKAVVDHDWGLDGGVGDGGKVSTTLFDAGWEDQPPQAPKAVVGKEASSGGGVGGVGGKNAVNYTQASRDPTAALVILKNVRSIRGSARQEYAKIYQALAPLYFDIVEPRNRQDPLVFRTYPQPEDQAQILANLKTFAQSDWAQGWQRREDSLESMTGIFENALLREFDLGHQAKDYEGQMRRCAGALVTLNGGSSGIDSYIQNNRLMREKDRLGNPLRCLEDVAHGHVDLGPSRDFFQHLVESLNNEAQVIDRVFPRSVDVMTPLLARVTEDILADYIAALFDEAYRLNLETYLKAVSGILEQSFQLAQTIKPSKSAADGFSEKVSQMIVRIFEPHLDLYLSEEVHFFRKKSNDEVELWEKQLSEQEASAESFFMSNVNRQAEKRDFLTSFKKVVMMPVNVLSINPTPSSSQPNYAKPNMRDTPNGSTLDLPSRSATPGLQLEHNITRSATPSLEAPTTELAAKAAIMNSKLEGIKSLFSIEVALNLVHTAKSSIERAARFVKLGGQWEEEAKMQCETVFVDLLGILGLRHIKPGFDKAVNHLTNYSTTEITEHDQSRVEPLVTFLELVNVGDLIQQMVDVFYAQELVAKKLTDPDDFLDAAVKEKKKFEQMLDERVAAGMNKGIDVLMQEVEHLCATTQAPTDFNPAPSNATNSGMLDIEPTSTSTKVVELVAHTTGMLVGSTDKNMLDVFNQEVGVRLFAALCKHLKRQRISTAGAIKLISDINHYARYVASLRNRELLEYFGALRELAQIFLIDAADAKEIATIIADGDRYHGIFRAEEVYEFAERRADWYQIKSNVEKAMYGVGCVMM